VVHLNFKMSCGFREQSVNVSSVPTSTVVLLPIFTKQRPVGMSFRISPKRKINMDGNKHIKKIKPFAMSIFANPFTSQWLIYLRPRLKSKTNLHKTVVCVPYESYNIIHVPTLQRPVFLIEALRVLCEVRTECKPDSLFFGGSASSSILLIPRYSCLDNAKTVHCYGFDC